MTNRSQKSGQQTAICHFSLVIGHLLLRALSVSAVRSILVAAGPRYVLVICHLTENPCRPRATPSAIVWPEGAMRSHSNLLCLGPFRIVNSAYIFWLV